MIGMCNRAGCYTQERAEPKASPPIRVTPPRALFPITVVENKGQPSDRSMGCRLIFP